MDVQFGDLDRYLKVMVWCGQRLKITKVKSRKVFDISGDFYGKDNKMPSSLFWRPWSFFVSLVDSINIMALSRRVSVFQLEGQ